MKSKNLHVGFRAARAWWPALVWSGVIFALSSVPGEHTPRVSFPFADKVVHFAVYLALGVCCARGVFVSAASVRGWRAVLVSAALATLFGVTDELHQTFVPGREADWKDAVADAFGALAGASVYVRILRRRADAAVATKFRS